MSGPVAGTQAAYGWRCATGSTMAPIDVTDACRWQYGDDGAYALSSDLDHAFSWRCYLPDPSPSQVSQLSTVSYRAFDGHFETLVPWQGEEVSVLSDPAADRDPGVMTKLVSALDRAYRFYATMTGREPSPYFTLNGRTTIAQVTSTCGAGCGYLGATGVEIASPFFEGMYQAAQGNLYDQIPFYELGRNFWFYGPQLAFRSPDQDPVISGYAVWMRYESMEGAKVGGDMPFEKFRDEVASLIDIYESNPSLTFGQTLAQNQSPGPYNGTDFWASIMMRLADRYGGEQFIRRFWERTSTLGEASSTAGAVANWVQAASYAACADLTSVFYSRWGFLRPDGSVDARPSAASVPDPAPGDCPQLPAPPPVPGPPPPQSPSPPSAPDSARPSSPAPRRSPASPPRTRAPASGGIAVSGACVAARARASRLGLRLRRSGPGRAKERLRARHRRARRQVERAC